MNILLTSAGRRGYLVEYFKKALNGRGEVHVGNSTPFSPVFYYADHGVITPLIYDEHYIPFLLDYCVKHRISLLISLFDVDLYVLAQHKKEFAAAGVTVVVSEPKAIEICNDKWKTYQFCMENGLHTPKTFCGLADAKAALAEGILLYPVIIKPRWGMGSIAIYQAENEQELEVLSAKVGREIFESYLKYESAFDEKSCILFQEKINGQEYGLDVIHDLAGNHCLTVVRKKLAMRSGETDCAQVLTEPEIEEIGTKTGQALSHRGNLDMDVFAAKDGIYVLEMNARFGGGYPFSHLAGVDLPGAILKWVEGKPLEDELTIKRTGIVAQKDIRMIDITDCVI